MKNSEITPDNVFTQLLKSANDTDARIERMEEKLHTLQSAFRKYWVVKINAVYYVGDDGNNMTKLANMEGAYFFPNISDAKYCANTNSYTNGVTGDKFKAECVMLATDALSAEIKVARESNEAIKRALRENGIEI